eukprot:4878695-Prymnesium_polylepis.1
MAGCAVARKAQNTKNHRKRPTWSQMAAETVTIISHSRSAIKRQLGGHHRWLGHCTWMRRLTTATRKAAWLTVIVLLDQENNSLSAI